MLSQSTIRGKHENDENLPFIPHNKVNFEIKLEKESIGVFNHPYLTLQINHAFAQDNPLQDEPK
jgi:hypothetical protein